MSKLSEVMSRKGCGISTPALFTRISIGPRLSTALFVSFQLVKSATTGIICGSSATNLSKFDFVFDSANTFSALRLANARAILLPIPGISPQL